MRQHPLLLILDEPAAALDASAEHDLFERYASAAAQAGREDGGTTVLISHRFSTVRMAGLIAVLDYGQLTECGHPPRAHDRPRALRRTVHPPGPLVPLARPSAHPASSLRRPGIDAGKRFAQMREAFDDAMVSGLPGRRSALGARQSKP
jgi:energy-coupling factor transporter ATP-binding protein EcfA2